MFDRPSLRRSAVLAAVVLLIDQTTKFWALSALREGMTIPFLPFVSLTLVHNSGAAFGSFSGWSGWVLAISGLLLLGIAFILIAWRLSCSPASMAYWALSAVAGGAAGNLADRIRFGAVIDFLDLGFWPVFNVADIAISIGSMVFALSLWKRSDS